MKIEKPQRKDRLFFVEIKLNYLNKKKRNLTE